MSAEVAVVEGNEPPSRFEQSLRAEQQAERELFRSIVKSILLALPLSIAVFVFIAAVSFSDKVDWYVWLGLGVGIGVVGAVLMGALAGATLNAHKLDEVDRQTYS
jgi:uncharacterized integral membrane protein